MRKSKSTARHRAALLLLLLAPSLGYGQSTLRIAALNEATSLPSLRMLETPIHPGFTIGADFLVKRGKHWQTAVGTDLSFFHHRLSENALMLDATYALGYRLPFGLQPKFLAALGYKHTLAAGEAYKLKNGSYEKVDYLGKPQFNAKIGFGLEYALNEKYSVTTEYKTMLVLPYSQKTPFALHTLLSMGMKVILKNNH